LKNAKNYFIEAKIYKLTALRYHTKLCCFNINSWLCVTYHLTWSALHTKRDKHHFYFWNLSKYKT